VLNVLRYPTLHSIMFWDMVSLGGYLLLNAIIAYTMLRSEREEVAPPSWIKVLVLLSIPWAVSIHTVTAFLYSGLPGRTFWLTAILAPRFLASAFASGPALLILLCLLLRRLTRFDAGQEAIRKLGVIVAYAMSVSIFFVLLEMFTVFYSHIPEDLEHFRYLYVGLDGDRHLAAWMWVSVITGVAALVILLVPRLRKNAVLLPLAAVLVIASLWIEKGMGLIVGGFVPAPFGDVTRYSPTLPEWLIVLGIWAIGALMITVFYKITVSVREAK
jgi:molybdopterin-containing oxidoreductase family membrane subunit